jgi:2-haloacid dehalogenase
MVMTTPKAYLFDAYGTLFDVHSVMSAGRAITGDPQALSNTWRQKQLEYTWLRSLMGCYEDFWVVTEEALRYAIRQLDITASEDQIRALMQAYLSLACFPETVEVGQGVRLSRVLVQSREGADGGAGG